MNREIKFRGKRVGSNEWVYGSYVNYQNPDLSRTIGIMTWMGVFFEVHPETVGQYTGLKDKDGNEIYEGDVYEINATKREIKFICGAFVCGIERVGYAPLAWQGEHEDDFFTQTVIVIGNIHDNPELIK